MSARDERIAPGDLVVVVRVHCRRAETFLGHVFRVKQLGMSPGWSRCTCCGEHVGAVSAAMSAVDDGLYPISGLKRIPPLDELERNEIVEELTA